ncbi:UNKNOWN [Stylonychia lemnae]|uniref:Uncharacterized protein n=1 Tax=Stylonychia lemnae TaxID=5949 RepID=A0A078BAC3_STYLE|nr:UNKNOWN [Stylonychia lemnae]|eukprot:CDW90463.1 UNKNOWN [Stylonychia lemnae]
MQPIVQESYIAELFSTWQRPLLALFDISSAYNNQLLSQGYDTNNAASQLKQQYNLPDLDQNLLQKYLGPKKVGASFTDFIVILLASLIVAIPLIDLVTAYFGIGTTLFSAFIVLRDPDDYAADGNFNKTLTQLMSVCFNFHKISTITMAVLTGLIATIVALIGGGLAGFLAMMTVFGVRVLEHFISGYLPNYFSQQYLHKII